MELEPNIITALQTRVQELENKVEALRISRRVLMNLIDALEKDKQEQLTKLKAQNQKLQHANHKYAQALMVRNIQMGQLEKKFSLLSATLDKNSHTFT